MVSPPTILIVDDEIRGLETLARILEDDFHVLTASNCRDAEALLRHDPVQIVLCDQRMPEMTGVEFLKQVRGRWPDIIRMIVSGYTDSDDIIRAINDAGIYQYITKPWHPDNLILTLKNAAQLFDLQRRNEQLSVELKMAPEQLSSRVAHKQSLLRSGFQRYDALVRAEDSPMNAACEKLLRVAGFDLAVLITGESGTGKELAARALHYNSPRWDKPFVVENCAALPDELLESELFGCKRGAYTGALEDRAGLFERADGGSIFLDEIGEVSPAFQVKLLRVLQEGEIRPLGSAKPRPVDVRVIAATNRDLEKEMRAGRFREDLYYRLTPFTVHLPPLRERTDDIPVLAKALLEAAMQRLGKRVSGFSEPVLNCLQAYAWPGNVRELNNEIQQMLVMANDDLLGLELLSGRVLHGGKSNPGNHGTHAGPDAISLKDRVEQLEAEILRDVLSRHGGNKSRAAEELGLSRMGLRAKLERYGLGSDVNPASVQEDSSDG